MVPQALSAFALGEGLMQAHAIIGAAFGDEGKGAITDRIASGIRNAVVVRFNGGAQAGHTVVAPDGRRHVFSHFGAGTLAGAATFLSRFFVVNPYLFAKELGALERIGAAGTAVMLDPSALVTTPYDMFINREVERARGAARHGSVGVGVNETMARGRLVGFRLTAADLWDDERTLSLLRAIRERWAPARLSALGVASLSEETRALFESRATADLFMLHVAALRRRTHLAGEALVGSMHHDAVLFEGAQGLLLDQDYAEFFPHVTHSRTGLANVLALSRAMGVTKISATYVMRAYMTRHGAGPFPTEFGEAACPMLVRSDDRETNRDHEFQGALRRGMLDLDRIARAVRADAAAWQPGHVSRLDVGLGLTCVDQIANGVISYVAGGEVRSEQAEAFAAATLERETALPVRFVGRGPARGDVHALPGAGRRAA
jgi:adenylosuccinate synthase